MGLDMLPSNSKAAHTYESKSILSVRLAYDPHTAKHGTISLLTGNSRISSLASFRTTFILVLLIYVYL